MKAFQLLLIFSCCLKISLQISCDSVCNDCKYFDLTGSEHYRYTLKITHRVLFKFVCKKSLSACDLRHFKWTSFLCKVNFCCQIFFLYFGEGNFGGKKFTLQRKFFHFKLKIRIVQSELFSGQNGNTNTMAKIKIH
jgi:hypothetical protein